MGRARTIARRSFLIGSTAVLGGVAFGTYLVQRPNDNPLLDKLPEGAASFNPWVVIDEQLRKDSGGVSLGRQFDPGARP